MSDFPSILDGTSEQVRLYREARKLSHRADPETAKQAAAAGALRKNTHRRLCLHYHAEKAQFHGGLTDDEVSEYTGLELHEARRRCSDLRNLGLIAWVVLPDGRRVSRPSRMGGRSTASLITPLGVEVLRQP